MVPRIRTIRQAVKEIKIKDPETVLTYHILKKLVENGTIPCINQESRKYVNLDTIYEYLNAAPNIRCV